MQTQENVLLGGRGRGAQPTEICRSRTVHRSYQPRSLAEMSLINFDPARRALRLPVNRPRPPSYTQISSLQHTHTATVKCQSMILSYCSVHRTGCGSFIIQLFELGRIPRRHYRDWMLSISTERGSLFEIKLSALLETANTTPAAI